MLAVELIADPTEGGHTARCLIFRPTEKGRPLNRLSPTFGKRCAVTSKHSALKTQCSVLHRVN